MSDEAAPWARVKPVFEAALDRPLEERARFVRDACGDDHALRQEVESLLLADGAAGDFAARPAFDALAVSPPAADGPRRAEHALPAGTRLGPYEVIAHVGRGGMGDVYRARDTRLGRTVAVKVLVPNVAADAGLRQRFEREARMLAALSHPHICAVFDVGHQAPAAGLDQAVDYLVMEYLDGETLAARLARGPLPLDEALQHAAQIAEALEAAHQHGVVHRDLKPGNVMLTAGGTKVLDFGLAKALGGDTPSPDLTQATPLQSVTREGWLLGTPAYMSPEQARGKAVDRRADLWAFGCVLFEMLTGKRTFSGDDVTETIAAVVREEPDWSALPASTPPSIQRLLRRALTKGPKNRLADASTARLEIEEALTEEQQPPLARAPTGVQGAPHWTPNGNRASLWRTAALLFLLTSLALLSLMVFSGRSPAPARVRFQVFPPANANFAGHTFQVSPDGRNLAYIATGNPGLRLWVHSLETGEARMLPVNNVQAPAPVVWSPDGRFLAFTSESKIKKIAVEGGSPQTLVDAPGGANDWSREDVLLFVQNGIVKRMPASGGAATPLTALDTARHEISHYLPRLLPDGRHFVYLRRSLAEETSGVYIGSIDARPEEQDLRRLVANAAMAVYAPGPEDPRVGHLLFNRGGQLLAQRFDAGALRLEGHEFPVADRLDQRIDPSKAAFFSASSNGILAYRQEEIRASTPVWVNRAGVEIAAITQSPLPGLEQVRLSPDGSQLAVIVRGDIWVYDLGGRPPIKLTSGGGIDMPFWSPNGREIVYARIESPFRLFSVPIEIGSTPTPVSPLGHYHPHGWSPDGRDLIAVLNSYSPSGWDIFKIPWRRDGMPEPFIKSSSDEISPALSPDGRWVAYPLNATGTVEIWVRPYAGPAAPVRVSANGGAEPRWAHDGTELYFLEKGRRVMAVAVKPGTTFNFMPPRPLFELPAAVFPDLSYDVAPDGRFLVMRPAPPPPSPTPITVVLNWASGVTN